MKKSIAVLSYVGVLGAGVAIGIFSTKSYFERVYKSIADEEIASVKRAFIIPETDIGEDFEPMDNDGVAPIADIPSYHEYATAFDNRAEFEHPEEEDTKKPYFIDIDLYDEATPGYAKKELSYYMEDETLLDAIDDELIGAYDTVGCENLEKFERSMESCCYIRNEMLKEDYEISKIFGSYDSIMDDND